MRKVKTTNGGMSVHLVASTAELHAILRALKLAREYQGGNNTTYHIVHDSVKSMLN